MHLIVRKRSKFGLTEWKVHWNLLEDELEDSQRHERPTIPFDFLFGVQYLPETLEGKSDIDPDVRQMSQKTMNVGACCMLTFFEYGFPTSAETFFDEALAHNLEYNYSVNENLFCLTNGVQFWSRSIPQTCQDKRREHS